MMKIMEQVEASRRAERSEKVSFTILKSDVLFLRYERLKIQFNFPRRFEFFSLYAWLPGARVSRADSRTLKLQSLISRTPDVRLQNDKGLLDFIWLCLSYNFITPIRWNTSSSLNLQTTKWQIKYFITVDSSVSLKWTLIICFCLCHGFLNSPNLSFISL